jgi:CheY-specific phosphatase CheX/anti-anti-sigma regulatory factor
VAVFTVEQSGSVLVVKCAMSLDDRASKELAEAAPGWIASPAIHVVLDCTRVLNIDKNFFKSVIQLKSALKSASKSLFTLGLNEANLKRLKAEGMEAAFNPVKTLDEVLNAAKPKPAAPAGSSGENKLSGLNMDFIQPFLLATKKTFETQIQTTIKPLTPSLKKGSQSGVDIASVLTLVSNGMSGSFVLCFSEEVFLKVYGSMVGESFDKITPEIEDAASEIVNIIYGLAKVDLNAKGYTFPKAFPTVLRGEKISIRQSGSKPAVIMPFETGLGKFHIEIEFEN